MKKTIHHIFQWPRAWMLAGLTLFSVVNALGQFQQSIGASFPMVDNASGVITPNGDLMMYGYRFDVLNLTGQQRIDWLDQSGNFTSVSKDLDVAATSSESGHWIEKNVFCGNGNEYVLVGDDNQGEMLVSRATLTGTLVWTRAIGSPGSIESGVWAEMDANGLLLALGNSYNTNNFISSVALAQLDCNGNTNWKNTFSINGYSLTATFGTTFPTAPGGFGVCYVTGIATSTLTGIDQLFLMQVNTGGGTPSFFKLYDIVPNANDAGTCIQGSFQFDPQGELWISGYSVDNNGLKTATLMKTDLNGTPFWAKSYDITGGDEFFNHFQFAANGKLVLTGKLLESTVFQGTKGGDCMLMRLDATTGNTIDWVHGYKQIDFTAQGNRVEVTANDEYFISGLSTEVLTPSISAGNILAIRTDNKGNTSSACSYDTIAHISPLMPVVSGFGLPSFILGFLSNNVAVNTTVNTFQDQQNSCAPTVPCDCDFTWTDGNCSKGNFTVTCTPATTGIYSYMWDYDCDPSTPNITLTASNTDPNATSFVQSFPYMFPCGGGTFNVCLKVTDPSGTVCNVMHTVTVSNVCCGSASGSMTCHPTDPYKYNFTINVSPDPSVSNCNYVLTSAYPLSNLLYSGNTITGCVAVTDPVPTALNFTLQSNCTCIGTGLPTTCTQTVWIPTVCCKKICVDDRSVCNGLDEFNVPFYACDWPPVNGVYQVNWYVQPKPATGCPNQYWGGTPYQSSVVTGNTLEPLHIFPNSLPGDLCVYVVIDLNDGPCTQIFSNIATISLCNPNSCTLNNQDISFQGTPVLPGLITLSYLGSPPLCLNTIEWYDENGIQVPPGNPINTYQPTSPLSLPTGFTGCYKDFFYTAVLTDECGPHSCQSRVRLYNCLAPIGNLTVSPPDANTVCFDEDITLNFDPDCVGNPPNWAWYYRDCQNNVTVLSNAGLMNTSLNLNELQQGGWYGVAAKNGTCPIKTEEEEIKVIQPAVLSSFSAVADACAEQQVVLSASVVPGVLSCGGGPFPCTYTYEWYKDGFLIGVTPNGSASESFTYLNPNPGPPPKSMGGTYYAVIREDCCPRNLITTWAESIRPACEQCIIGPCFVCDNQPETFTVIMVLPPNEQCPDVCTFTWYDAIQVSGNWVMNNVIGTGSSVTISSGGHYFLVSDCNGCIKKTQFDVLGCSSQMMHFGQSVCGVISVEELMHKEESPLHIYPNPTTGEFTIEWSGNAPKNAKVFITDPMGRRLKMLTVPDVSNSLTTSLEDMPSGLYFVKVQSADRQYNVAKLVKE